MHFSCFVGFDFFSVNKNIRIFKRSIGNCFYIHCKFIIDMRTVSVQKLSFSAGAYGHIFIKNYESFIKQCFIEDFKTKKCAVDISEGINIQI